MKIYILLGLFIMNACSETVQPPKANKKPHKMMMHGHDRVDDYYWMRLNDEQKLKEPYDQRTQEVVDYINAENYYLKKDLSHTENLQDSLYNEMIGRIKKDDQTVPYLQNGYYYYHRFEKGKEYAIHCRKKDNLNNDEEIILDENKLAEGYKYFSLGGKYVSPDNNWLAFSVDTLSRRFYDIYFMNLETGEVLDNPIQNTEGDIAWANDNRTIFYTTKNKATLLSEKIYRHKIGTLPKDDILVYHEDDIEFYTGVYRSKSGEYIIIWSSSTLVSDYHILKADDPEGELINFTPRVMEHEYTIEHLGDKFYIITNWEAKNNRLMEVSEESTIQSNWLEVLPHKNDVHIMEIDVFKEHLVVNERIDGTSKLRIINQTTGDDRHLNFKDDIYYSYISTNKEYDTSTLRFVYNSLTTPRCTYDYNMNTGEMILLKQQEVMSNYNQSDYEAERIYVVARDGFKIPVSIVYNKKMRKSDPQNLLLYGYGAYGSTEDPYFSSTRLSLLDRGFIFGIAHIRGSQIYGRMSYDDGKLFKKMNTFNDFIDVGNYLIDQNYTDSDHLFCSGGSAGGLLIGAVVNMEPNIWKGAIAGVPFVDVITTMLDPSIPLTSNEWDEWGDPREKDYYEYMLSYSPYDQIKNQHYPNLLVTAGFFDSQVQYWEPLKWVAKLRDHWDGDNKLYLYTNMDAGHGGNSGRFKRYKEYALEYAFLLNLAGIDD